MRRRSKKTLRDASRENIQERPRSRRDRDNLVNFAQQPPAIKIENKASRCSIGSQKQSTVENSAEKRVEKRGNSPLKICRIESMETKINPKQSNPSINTLPQIESQKSSASIKPMSSVQSVQQAPEQVPPESPTKCPLRLNLH